jgi:hypothetical protein
MHNLTFSDISGCSHKPSDTSLAIVHACKEPCHRCAAGYTQKSLPADHPHYLFLVRGNHLYLNLIDPPVPLFKRESFTAFFAFVDAQIKHRPVHIHCNKGESRAPSLTLLYRAKRGLLPDESYDAARAAFEVDNPYKPGKGIETYLRENWHDL